MLGLEIWQLVRVSYQLGKQRVAQCNSGFVRMQLGE